MLGRTALEETLQAATTGLGFGVGPKAKGLRVDTITGSAIGVPYGIVTPNISAYYLAK